MNTVNFYDKSRNLVFQLKDFKFSNTKVLKVVSFTGEGNFDFINFNSSFEAEEYDFINLKLSLEKLYNGSQKFISFNPLSGRFFIKFSLDNNQINVNCEVSNDLSTVVLNLKYCIDQSFIPELLIELDKVLKEKD